MRKRSQNEGETLKTRQINLTLSDFEVKALFREASSRGTTVEDILEGFIGDLVGGYHYHGSDESRLASEYLERVIYSFNDDESFLQWLLNYGDLEDVAQRLEIIEDGEDEDSRDEARYQRQQVEESFEDYLSYIGEERASEVDQEKELQRVKSFIQSWKSLSE